MSGYFSFPQFSNSRMPNSHDFLHSVNQGIRTSHSDISDEIRNILNAPAVLVDEADMTVKVVDVAQRVVDDTNRIAQHIISPNPVELPQMASPLISSTPVPDILPPAIDPGVTVGSSTVIRANLAESVPLATLAAETLKKSSPWMLPPLILWGMYMSKESLVTNINLGIDATSESKGYKISIQKGDNSVSFAFEVKSGLPIRLLEERDAGSRDSAGKVSLFQPENVTNEVRWGPFGVFAWKRKEHFAEVNIFINDPAGNMKKIDKDVSTEPISDTEFIHFIYDKAPVINHLDKQKMGGMDAIHIETIELDPPAASKDPRIPHTQRRIIPSIKGEPPVYVDITQQVLEY